MTSVALGELRAVGAVEGHAVQMKVVGPLRIGLRREVHPPVLLIHAHDRLDRELAVGEPADHGPVHVVQVQVPPPVALGHQDEPRRVGQQPEPRPRAPHRVVVVGDEGRRGLRRERPHRAGQGVRCLDVDTVHHAAVPREHDFRPVGQPRQHAVVVVRGGILFHRHRCACVQVEYVESSVVEFAAGEHGWYELGFFERLQPFDGRDPRHAVRADPGDHQTLRVGRPWIPQRRLHVPLLVFVAVLGERDDPAIDGGAERQVVIVEADEPLPVRGQALRVRSRPQPLKHFPHERLGCNPLGFAHQVRHESQRGRRPPLLQLVCVEVEHKGLPFHRELHGRSSYKRKLSEGYAQARGLVTQRPGQRGTQASGVEQLVDDARGRIDPVNDGVLRPALGVPEAVAVGHPVGGDAAALDEGAEVEIAFVGGFLLGGDLGGGRWDKDRRQEQGGDQWAHGPDHGLLQYSLRAEHAPLPCMEAETPGKE